ncbi:MAG TPA: VOC family protein [archaeon]|nr:VOC family protein [archaeon]
MAIAKYSLTVIDCPNPVALANFYSQLTGFEMEPLGEIDPKDVKWFDLLRNGKAVIGFQRVENYVAPTWPEGPVPQQIHLDFDVANLDEAEIHVLALGAQRAQFQSSDKFRVYLDPVGHPFCLVLNPNLENFQDPLTLEVTTSRI